MLLKAFCSEFDTLRVQMQKGICGILQSHQNAPTCSQNAFRNNYFGLMLLKAFCSEFDTLRVQMQKGICGILQSHQNAPTGI